MMQSFSSCCVAVEATAAQSGVAAAGPSQAPARGSHPLAPSQKLLLSNFHNCCALAGVAATQNGVEAAGTSHTPAEAALASPQKSAASQPPGSPDAQDAKASAVSTRNACHWLHSHILSFLESHECSPELP